MIRYSKSFGDLQPEFLALSEAARDEADWQRRVVDTLLTAPLRSHCVLCGKALQGAQLTHRSFVFVECEVCGHLQTEQWPPPDYPGRDFATLYAKLSPADYASRKRRVYAPKLEWALETMAAHGIDGAAALGARWLELGCGAGYFLSALRDLGVNDLHGIDEDPCLLEIAAVQLGADRVSRARLSLAEEVLGNEADVYAAFFVLEHLSDLGHFLETMRGLRTGTVFVFSVPVYGLSCMLENAFPGQMARNLDVTFHTQLFTDRSIDFALDMMGFAKLGEWVFGQDAMDLARFLSGAADHDRNRASIACVIERRMLAALDDLQEVLDRNGLADQRHIVARKA